MTVSEILSLNMDKNLTLDVKGFDVDADKFSKVLEAANKSFEANKDVMPNDEANLQVTIDKPVDAERFNKTEGENNLSGNKETLLENDENVISDENSVELDIEDRTEIVELDSKENISEKVEISDVKAEVSIDEDFDISEILDIKELLPEDIVSALKEMTPEKINVLLEKVQSPEVKEILEKMISDLQTTFEGKVEVLDNVEVDLKEQPETLENIEAQSPAVGVVLQDNENKVVVENVIPKEETVEISDEVKNKLTSFIEKLSETVEKLMVDGTSAEDALQKAIKLQDLDLKITQAEKEVLSVLNEKTLKDIQGLNLELREISDISLEEFARKVPEETKEKLTNILNKIDLKDVKELKEIIKDSKDVSIKDLALKVDFIDNLKKNIALKLDAPTEKNNMVQMKLNQTPVVSEEVTKSLEKLATVVSEYPVEDLKEKIKQPVQTIDSLKNLLKENNVEKMSVSTDVHQESFEFKNSSMQLNDISSQVTKLNLNKGLEFSKVMDSAQQKLSLNEQNILNQVNKQATEALNQGKTQVNIVLRPENLGRVNLNIVSDKGVLTAQITAESQQAKDALTKGLDSLKQTLQEQGVKVASISVRVQEAAASESNQFDFSQNKNNEQNQTSTAFNQNNERNVGSKEEQTGHFSGKMTEDVEQENEEEVLATAEIDETNSQTKTKHDGLVDYTV